MEYYSKSDIGKVRSKNQDQVAVMINNMDQVLAIVCDGMGGHKAGEVASRAMINYVTGCFQGHPGFEDIREIPVWLKETIQNGHELIRRLASTTEEHEGMGTTIVAAIISDDIVFISHVGDSRAYYYDSKVHVLTKDHTLLNVLLDQGSITEEQALHFEQKNVLVQAIGGTDTIEISQTQIQVDNGYLLLCSDGLFNMVSEDCMNQLLKESMDIHTMGDAFIAKANENGGLDNISVVLVKLGGHK